MIYLIEDYFGLGYTFPEIMAFPCLSHGIVIRSVICYWFALTEILCARGTSFHSQFSASISLGQKINTVSRLLRDERARAYRHWYSVASSKIKKSLKFNFAEFKV